MIWSVTGFMFGRGSRANTSTIKADEDSALTQLLNLRAQPLFRSIFASEHRRSLSGPTKKSLQTSLCTRTHQALLRLWLLRMTQATAWCVSLF